jgi:hypothetical protein
VKVVLNRCFGGFGLSPRAVARAAELAGRACFFFIYNFRDGGLTPCSIEEAEKSERIFRSWRAFDTAFPSSFAHNSAIWATLDQAEREAANDSYASHDLTRFPDRSAPHLVRAVEELGAGASALVADLRVIEIPFDGPDGWSIDEYDGMESVEEDHRSFP